MGVQERRARERDARRKAVLDAARELVRERGYNGTTTKQIAAACELSEATLFWYFRSKDEIFTSLLFEAIEFMQRRIDALDTGQGSGATDAPDPAALLTGIWGIFTELRAGYPEYFQVFTSLASPDATAAVSPEIKEELVRRSGENFRRVSELVGWAMTGQRPRLDASSDRDPDASPMARVDNANAPAVPSETAWTRIATDVLWASFVGLGVLHDSRVNLGAPEHPTPPELDQAFQLLISGLLGGLAETRRPVHR